MVPMTGRRRNALDLDLCDPSNLTSQRCADARALDAAAVQELGLPSIVLMENAARGAALVLRQEFGADARVLVLAGKGNNGGDGMALARWFLPRAQVALLGEPDPERSPDAALQLSVLRRSGVGVDVAAPVDRLEAMAAGADVLVDALLGTGLSSAPRGEVAEWIEWMRDQALPVLAIDLPSGLDSDTGEAFEPCARANVTVSFARPKRGLLERDGPARSGRVHVTSLGLAEPWVEARDG
jgi:hydroxyethylthiazole kinase-like uncharacterized protein yjeF